MTDIAIVVPTQKHGPRTLQPPAAQGRARADPLAEPFGAKGPCEKIRRKSPRRDSKKCLDRIGDGGVAAAGDVPDGLRDSPQVRPCCMPVL
jgi:hypothetical protein